MSMFKQVADVQTADKMKERRSNRVRDGPRKELSR